MSQFEEWQVERRLRMLHGWLGALILPWVVLAGLTGLYLNHRSLVMDYLPTGNWSAPEAFASTDVAQPVPDAVAAIVLAASYRPLADLKIDKDTSYQGREVWTVDTGPDAVIVDRATGFVWLEERYRITAFAPNGTKLGSTLRWSRVLSSLHSRGWVGTALGRWPADITAMALVAFGLSGLVIFWSPRLRRRRNRKARERAAPAAR